MGWCRCWEGKFERRKKRGDIWKRKKRRFFERSWVETLQELKSWGKILGVSEGLAPGEKEKKGRKEKRKTEDWEEKWERFLKKNRENGKEKWILRKRKKGFLWFALVRRKRDRDHQSWVDFIEGESISLEAKEHLSKAGSFRVCF